MVEKKFFYQWPLAKNDNIHATSDQCAVSDEVFRAMGKKSKKKKNMDQINKTDTNDISSSFYIMLL